MPTNWSQFTMEHWTVGGILVSLLWFLAGTQSLSKRGPDAAMRWQVVAAIISLIVCGWAAAERQWLGLVFGIVVFCVEARSIRHVYLGMLKNQQ